MKIVVITSRFPYPIEKGDKLRAYHHIRGLAHDHEVHLISISHQLVDAHSIASLEKYCKKIHVFYISRQKLYLNVVQAVMEGLPMQVGYFLDQRLKNKIQQLILRIEPDHIFAQLIRTSEYVRNLPFPKTLDYMDAFSVGMKQRGENGNLLLRPLFRYESKVVGKYERSVYRDFDHHCIISEQDRDRLQIDYTKNVQILPNGVNADYFSRKPLKIEYDLVFVGNMGYRPNIEAAIYLVKQILPECHGKGMQLKVLIAGARPHRRIQNLASEKVHVSGWMDDIRIAYSQSKIFVAPIFSGMGQQNKILEGMSMSMPCITTKMVNNAIGAVDRKHLYTAQNPDGFATVIHRLLQNKDERTQTGIAARMFIKDKYSWEAQLKKLHQIITKESILAHLKSRIA